MSSKKTSSKPLSLIQKIQNFSEKTLQNPTYAKLFRIFFYALPVLLFFSYYPKISLGATDSMNLEFSLPLLWLIIFAVFASPCIPSIITSGRRIFSTTSTSVKSTQTLRRFTLTAFAFLLFATASIFWSLNPLRALLTVAILWLIVYALAVFAVFLQHQKPSQKPLFTRNFLGVFLLGSIAVSLFCWVQCLLDLFGLGRESTLACAGCTAYSFGFPHPSGFAIEPQFMGNLLLAPVFLVLYLLFFGKKSPKNQPSLKSKFAKLITFILSRKVLWFVLFILLATLFLTFSRGAIYAFVVGLILLIIIAIKQRKFRWSLIFTPVIAFLFTLCAQGLMAQFSYTNDTFITGTTKAIHHLTLGKIDLRPSELRDSTNTATKSDESEAADTDTLNVESEDSSSNAAFSGYVAESTAVRENLTAAALKLWMVSPRIATIGVGLGAAGSALNLAFPDEFSAKEIVQNEYASLLLELGTVGFALAALAAFFFLRLVWQSRIRPLLLPLALAFAVTLCFFSGLPNALHIYLIPPILLILAKEV